MALKATIFRAGLQIADMERNYYQEHALTIARHPSETDERMMVRVLVFALHAGAGLSFGRGLSDEDEPDLWLRDLTGDIKCWIDVGLPDEKRIRRACGRAEAVFVYAYGGRSASVWWDQLGEKLDRHENLTVVHLPVDSTRAMAALAQRNMQLNCSIQDGQVWFSDEKDTVQLQPQTMKSAVSN